MEFLRYLRTSLFQVISLLCVLGFLLGILNLHFSDKTNYCDMTYMFEYPQFVRIHFNDTSRYPAYGLYAYSEGRLTEKARKVRFDGIPVLFLPGNAGSHMQARSLASVALRKALSAGYDFHFDYFTVSYNEELTGFYGGTLEKQTEFAAKCINKILDLYTANKYTKYVPHHVITIGHSMGGVIANRLLAYNETIYSTKIAITLAAPLEAPVVLFDSYQDSFYHLMESEWIHGLYYVEGFQDEKMLISFGNGPRDVLVPSGLTSYTYSFISVLTTALPGAWVSPDHVCIVWCKQVVMAINKYLFSLVDPRTLQIEDDMKIVKEKAKSFFVANRAITLDPSKPLQSSKMVADAFWYEDNRRIYQVSRPGIEKMTYLMIRLVEFPQNRFVAIEAVNVDDREWIFGCNAKETYSVHRYCKQAYSLSKLNRWTPAANKTFGKRKLATIHLHNLKKQHPDWTHVVVKVSPTREPVTLNIDVNDHASRQFEVDLPSRFFSFDMQKTIIDRTEEMSLYYELILNNFDTLAEAYLLYVEPDSTCQEYHVSAEVHVPWAKNHDYHHYYTHLKRSPMKLRLFTTNLHAWQNKSERVKITLLMDPRCSFTVSISSSWYHILGQLVRNYTPLLIPFIVGIVIMAAACNISNLYDTGSCMYFHAALDCEFMKPYYVIWLGKVLFFVLSFFPYLDEFSSLHNIEIACVLRSSVEFLIYMVAVGLLSLGMLIVMGALAVSSQIYRFISRMLLGGGRSLGERLAYAMRKVPILLSAVMIATVPVSCGAAALAIGAAFYAYLLSQMFQDYLEDLCYQLAIAFVSYLGYNRSGNTKRNANGEEIKWRNLKELEEEGCKPTPSSMKKPPRKPRNEEFSNINFHVMMFSLWIMSMLVNLPTLLAWARNFKYESKLYSDPSFTAGLLLSVCSGYIWQLDGPKDYLENYAHLSTCIYIVGLFVIVFGPFYLGIANHALTVVFCAITLQQLIDGSNIMAYFICMQTEPCENNDANEKNKRKKNRRTTARKWKYFGQIISGTREHVGNLINKRNRKKSREDTSDDKHTVDSKEKTDVDSEGENNNEEGTSKNAQGTSKKAQGTSKNVEGTSEKINKSDEDSKINNGNKNSENNCEGNGTNDSGLGADALPEESNAGSCDESKIFTVFKNLKEKLNFNE